MKKKFLIILLVVSPIMVLPSLTYDECMSRHKATRVLNPETKKILRECSAKKIADSFNLGYLQNQYLGLSNYLESEAQGIKEVKQLTLDNSYIFMQKKRVKELLAGVEKEFSNKHRLNHKTFKKAYAQLKRSDSYKTLVESFPVFQKSYHQEELTKRLQLLYIKCSNDKNQYANFFTISS